MPKNHLKTHNAPRTWNIPRKQNTFVTRPNPGAHKMDLSMPLNIILKNLGKAKTNKEATKITHDQEVLVNGKRRKDVKYPVGLFDVLSIPKINEHYTLLINEYNTLYIKPIEKKESEFKLSKITGKKITSKGLIQIKTLDGRTILAKKDSFKTGDSIIISIPGQEVKETYKMDKGAQIYLFRGKYVGKTASVVEIKDKVLLFKKGNDTLETKKEYAIVIGKDKPIIKL